MSFRLAAAIFIGAIVAIISIAQTPLSWKGKNFKEGDVTVVINPKDPAYKNDQSKPSIHKVVIVDNPSQPKYKESIIKLDLELEIGDKENGKFILNRPTQLTLDNQNNLYILDIEELNVKKFNPQGHYLLTIGKPGPGPGELNGVNGIFIANDELVAWCGQNSRLNYFDLNGKFLRSSQLSVRIDQLNGSSRGKIFGISGLYEHEGEQALVQLNDSFGIGKVMDKRPWEPPRFYGVGLLYYLAKDDSIIVSNPANYKDYELKVFSSDGELIKLIRKEHRPLRIPREDIESVRKNNPGNWKIPDYYMPYYRIYADETGRIIIATLARRGVKEEMAFDVFDKEGKYLSKVVFNSYFYYCLWDNGRLYTVEESAEGFSVVRIYRITW